MISIHTLCHRSRRFASFICVFISSFPFPSTRTGLPHQICVFHSVCAYFTPFGTKGLRHSHTGLSASTNGDGNSRKSGSSDPEAGKGDPPRFKRLARKMSSKSFSFNQIPGRKRAADSSDSPDRSNTARMRPSPPSSSPSSFHEPRGSGPISEAVGQHLTPEAAAPPEIFDVDARPNSQKARKVASSQSQGKGHREEGLEEDNGAGGWQRPSRVQQRREKRQQAAMDEKMRRVKIQRFGKEGLLFKDGLAGGQAGGGRDDALQCEHFGACSGCFYRSGLVETPVMENARVFFQRVARYDNFSLGLATGVHGWRTQAKLAVAPLSKWGGCQLGLYEEGSHRVLPIPNCRVHHPSINRAVQVLTEATVTMKTRAFDPASLGGSLRYVQVAVERRTGRIQLTLVWNAPGKKEAGGELSRLLKALKAADASGELWHSIWVNFRTGPGNTIFAREARSWTKLFGADFLTEKIGPSQTLFYLTPQLFRQGNLDGFEKLVTRAQEFVPAQSVVCELYGGGGVIGLNMLGKAAALRFSDINPYLGQCVDKTLQALPAKKREKVSFIIATALEALEAGHADGATVLIVDPPRKGLESEVLAHLVDRKDPYAGTLRRIVYVSCGFEALKRDAVALMDSGWRLVHAEGFVLFPGSDHLETLAVFDRTR